LATTITPALCWRAAFKAAHREGFDEVPIEYTGPNMTIGFDAK
jgi:hypothetical protein